MRLLLGLDDTDSSRGYCTTYLAYRVAADLGPDVRVLPYPRLVRLNPNIPFKTRGNAAVCLQLEAADPHTAYELVSAKLRELSDVGGGANSGMVLLDAGSPRGPFADLYLDALCGMVSPHRARKVASDAGAMTYELGNGMGVVGAASSIGFDERFDHTYELIAYRKKENWGSRRLVESGSVKKMDASMFPRVYNNYDYQKRKVLVAPHGPDPVLVGIRGDSPSSVLGAYRTLALGEEPLGHMVYLTNQHTDAHLQRLLDWKVYSSGWLEARVDAVSVGEGGHVYIDVLDRGERRRAAAYEPTGDLNRVARRLKKGDRVRAYGGVRRGTSRHPKILNIEKFETLGRTAGLPRGVYVSSPRSNRHLTKPLIRYGREDLGAPAPMEGWLQRPVIAQPARS